MVCRERICDESPAAPLGKEERLEASSQEEDSGVPERREEWIRGGVEQRVHQQDGLAMTALTTLIYHPACTRPNVLIYDLGADIRLHTAEKIKYLVISLTKRSERQRRDQNTHTILFHRPLRKRR